MDIKNSVLHIRFEMLILHDKVSHSVYEDFNYKQCGLRQRGKEFFLNIIKISFYVWNRVERYKLFISFINYVSSKKKQDFKETLKTSMKLRLEGGGKYVDIMYERSLNSMKLVFCRVTQI